MHQPEFIGRYAVRRKLGAGGFAVVWLGYDDRLDDHVAIKVLADNLAERLDLRDRFTREARALRRTRSRYLVEVYDIDELPDHRPYFVMAYADGGSLADLVGERALPVEELVRIGADMASGVQDLHDAGLVHRDLKPSNVLFRSVADGPRQVLIADLGLSRELARGSRITLTAGTPGFMAPEQAANEGGADHRADVYGLAATVYFGLTGREPATRPVPPSTVRDGLPPGTDEVVLRGLARNPDDRWPTALAFGDALRGLLDGHAPPRPSRGRRHRWTIVAAAVALCAAATFAAVSWFDEPAPRQATQTGAPCAADRQECFLHAEGNPAYLLDFYSHNHEVVIWERKPDDDTYAYSQRWKFRRVENEQAYLVYNAHMDRCLTAAGKDAQLQVKPCDPADPGQRWQWADGTLESDVGACADIRHDEYRMGNVVIAHPCTGRTNQSWVARPT